MADKAPLVYLDDGTPVRVRLPRFGLIKEAYQVMGE